MGAGPAWQLRESGVSRTGAGRIIERVQITTATPGRRATRPGVDTREISLEEGRSPRTWAACRRVDQGVER